MSENSTSNFVVSSEQPGHEFEKAKRRLYEPVVRDLDEEFKAWMTRWENMARKFGNSGQSPSRDDETRLTHLEKEIEDLKKDKLVKDVIIGELLLRISKLEAAQSIANRM